MPMKRLYTLLCLVCIALTAAATTYYGRVVDGAGQPVSYATVFPLDSVILGTATNDRGIFSFEANLPESGLVMVSFVGYERKTLPLSRLHGDTLTITIHERPIALDETTVSAKHKKIRSKHREIAQLLLKVNNQLASEWPEQCTRYHVVSEARMTSQNSAWGMEQMIASIVTIPEVSKKGSDSVQLHAEHCKRFFKPEIRQRANIAYQAKELDARTRQYAAAIDSGVAVHSMLFQIGDAHYDLEQTMHDYRHWKVVSESANELILSHTEGKNYLGIFKWSITRNYVVNPKTYALIRLSEHLTMDVNIPFGKRLKGQELLLLNLLNMSESQYEKFRLRKGHLDCTLQTTYQRRNGQIYILEKNLRTDATITGTKDRVIPIHFKAGQRVTSLETQGVKPLKRNQITKRFPRQIVEIF